MIKVCFKSHLKVGKATLPLLLYDHDDLYIKAVDLSPSIFFSVQQEGSPQVRGHSGLQCTVQCKV
jgi:hypothetical protein